MRKKRFVTKFLSWLIVLGLNVSLYPSNSRGRSASVKVCDQQVKDQITIVDTEQMLDQVSFLQDSDSLIGDNEWEELEIDIVLENWQKYCKTKFDRWGIKKLLKYAPKGSKEIIKYLVENDDSFNLLGKVLDEVKVGQDALLAYWNKDDLLHHSAEGLYYSIFNKLVPRINNYLNNSTTALEVTQALSLAKPVFNLLALLGVGGLVRGYIFSKLSGGMFNWKKSLFNGVTALSRLHNFKPKVYKSEFDYRFSTRFKVMKAFMSGTTGDFNLMTKFFVKRSLLKNYFQGNDALRGSVAGSLSIGFWVLMVLWKDYSLMSGFKGSVGDIFTLHKIASCLQGNLVKVANVMRALNCVESIKVTSEDQDCFALYNVMKYVKKDSISKELVRLFDLLNSSTFKRPASFFYSKGRLLNAHRLIDQNKDELMPLLQNIALLGGYRAIAQMVREHQNTKVGYCFVQCVDQSEPLVSLKNAWVPLVKKECVITNNFQLGLQGKASSAVFTGPNGGGKSTSMITVAFNVLLSQLGIAAADEAYISNFSKIRTSLRPQQNIKDGLSSFMAEHKRVSDVANDIRLSKGNVLVLVDEPYKGTVESEAAHRVYRFGKSVVENKNCMLLMATHLRKPIELAQDTQGFVANYQMGYIENESGSFKRTFEVLQGPAIWWFDNAEKRTKFVDWLCENEI